MDDRRDDWRHRVDEHLVNITTAQKVTDRQLDDLEIALDVLDKLIRGDQEEETSGLIGRLEKVEHFVAELRAVVIMDAAGRMGLQHEVAVLSSGERIYKEKWQMILALWLSVITLSGFVVTNWDKITLFLHKKALDLEAPVVHKKHRRVVVQEPPDEQ